MEDSDIEIIDTVEDSEPERERQAALKKRLLNASAAAPQPPAPIASTSTSSTTQPQPQQQPLIKKRRKPWEQPSSSSPPLPPAPPTAAAPPSPTKRRKSCDPLPQPQHQRKKHAPSSSTSSSSSSGFQSASSLLKTNPILLLDDDDDDDDELEVQVITSTSKKGKGKVKETVKRKAKSSRLSISSVEWDDDKMDEDLPPGGEGDASGEASSASEEELTAVEKFKGTINKFHYQSNPRRSFSTATSEPPPLPKFKPRKHPPQPANSAPIPEIDLPHSSRISVLTSCPLCQSQWAASKSLPTKTTHLKNCANEQDYTAETVRVLVEKQILGRAKECETLRREKEGNRSLFERVVGVGEGVAGKKFVQVVGVEKRGEDVKSVQEELEEKMKKVVMERVVKVAMEIKLEREKKRELERKKEGIKARNLGEMGMGGVEREEEFEFPQATGMLRPDSTARQEEVQEKAMDLLKSLGGTGLTQSSTSTSTNLPPPTSTKGKEVLIISDEDSNDNEEPPPPPTQTFKPSRLADRLSKTGQVQVVRLSSSKSTTTVVTDQNYERGRVEKKGQKVKEEEGTTSLWEATKGTDDEVIRRVVPAFSSPSRALHRSSPPGTPSPTRSLERSAPSTPTSLNNSTPSTTKLFQLHQHHPLEEKDSPRHLSLATKMLGLDLESEISGGGEGEGGVGVGMEWEDDQVMAGGGMLVWDGVDDVKKEEESVWSEVEELMNEATTSTKTLPMSKSTTTKTLPKSKPKIPSIPKPKPKPKSTIKKTTSPPSPSLSASDPFNFSSSISSPDNDSSSSSSDDTPLQSTSKPKPTKSTSTSTSTKPPPPPKSKAKPKSKSSKTHEPPDYASWEIPKLQNEVSKYGYRRFKERSVLVEQLTKIWWVLNPAPPPVPEEEEGEEVEEKKEKKKVVRRKKKEEEEDDGESVGEKVRRMIVGDEILYSRVLRYEPIAFDEFLTLAALNGIKCAKPILMRCLDAQCITFYTSDPTVGGTRKRYK